METGLETGNSSMNSTLSNSWCQNPWPKCAIVNAIAPAQQLNVPIQQLEPFSNYPGTFCFDHIPQLGGVRGFLDKTEQCLVQCGDLRGIYPSYCIAGSVLPLTAMITEEFALCPATTLEPGPRLQYNLIPEGRVELPENTFSRRDTHSYHCPLPLKENRSYPCRQSFYLPRTPVSKAISHINTHLEPYQCQSCFHRAGSSSNLERHKASSKCSAHSRLQEAWGPFAPRLIRGEWICRVNQLQCLKETEKFLPTQLLEKIDNRRNKFEAAFAIAQELLNTPECTHPTYHHSSTKNRPYVSSSTSGHFSDAQTLFG